MLFPVGTESAGGVKDKDFYESNTPSQGILCGLHP